MFLTLLYQFFFLSMKVKRQVPKLNINILLLNIA